MSQKEVAIVGKNNTKAEVTGKNELKVKVGSYESTAFEAVGVERTPTITRPAAAGTVTAGKFSVSIANVGAANGTVLGTTLEPGETVSFDAGAINNTLAAIAYDATGTEFLIITIG